jgi:hypothetical protein
MTYMSSLSHYVPKKTKAKKKTPWEKFTSQLKADDFCPSCFAFFPIDRFLFHKPKCPGSSSHQSHLPPDQLMLDVEDDDPFTNQTARKPLSL